MAYNKTTWENLPSTNTPITASNLNNIENEVKFLDDNTIYDNTEKVVGTWFGKPLYRKTFNLLNVPTKGTNKGTTDYTYNHGIENIEVAWIGGESFIYGTSDNTFHNVNSYIGSTTNAFLDRAIHATVDLTKLSIYVGTYSSLQTQVNICVSVYYTKTTD